MFLCTDFDGTLRNPTDPTILNTNLAALTDWRQAGNYACLVTGRNHSTIPDILPQWNNYLDFLITDNGGAIYENNDSLIRSYYFSQQLVEDILATISRDILPAFYYPDSYSINPDPTALPIKIRLWHRDLKQLWARQHYLSSGILPIKSLPWPKPGFSLLPGVNLTEYCGFIDVVPEESGKDSAIKHLAKICSASDVITIGDDYNDIAMLQCFEGYAINSALPEVIQATAHPTFSSVAELIYFKMSRT